MHKLVSGRIDGFKNFFNIFKLSDLESALQKYKGAPQYDAAIRYYNGCIVGLASDKELEPLGLLRDVLISLPAKSRRRRSTEAQVQSATDTPEALELIVDKLDDYARRKTNSQNILKLGSSEIPRKMHFVWLGGGIGAIQKDYINIWKQIMTREGFTLNLWFDRDALLAHKTNQVIVAAAKEDALSSRNGRADDSFDLADDYVARARVLKQQMFEHINEYRAAGGSADEARIDLLVKAYGQDEKALRELRSNNEQSVRGLADEQFFLRDLQDPSNALPLADIYHREIAFRMNLAAASDVVRFPVEYVEGGIYSDVDYLPPFAEKLAGIEVNKLSARARLGMLQLLLNRNPQWMPGRDAGRYKSYIDDIPQEHRATLEEYAGSQPSLNDVFVAPKSLNVEADGVRAAIVGVDGNPEEIVDIRMNNSFLMSHPGSKATKAVLDRLQLSYDMMDAAEARLLKEGGSLEPGELYETAQIVIQQTLENYSLPELEMYRVGRYAQAVVQYHDDGISPESGATIYISGPAVMRGGLATFAATHFTPEGAKKWAELINLNDGFNNATEEEQDHSWQENRGGDQWLAKELSDWQQGKLTTRYQGNVHELLKRRTITFENGWPLIEGRHVLRTDILQHLADGLGEPFFEAMSRGHAGEVTFHADVSLSYEQRQQILAQAPGVGPSNRETDEHSLSLDRMLQRIASNELQMTHLSPGQKLLLGSVFECTTLDNAELGRAWSEIEAMAQGISGLGITSRYAAIERELFKRNNVAFAAGMASASGYTPAHVDDAFKMKKQALEEPSTLRGWGGRVAQIQKVALLQYREEISARMSLVLESFNNATHALVPQDLLLDGVGERIGGRCVPLSLAMAAALQKGQQASRNLYEKFYLAVGEPNAVDSTLFLQSLDALQDAPLDELGQSLQRSELAQAISVLEQGPSPRTLMLNSDNHAMLLAKTLQGERSLFHFYDPNFGVFQFEDPAQFTRTLEEFFVGHKMADFYAAFGEPGRPTFDLVDIDGATLHQWPLPSGGHVSDLVEETALTGEPQAELLPRLARARGRSLSGNPRLGRSLMELDGRWWAGQMTQASTQLLERNQLGPEFLPLFQTMEKTSAGAYEISLINPKDPQQIRRVTTVDSRLWKIKNFLSEKFASLSHKPQSPAEPASVHTLNAGFALQALISALMTHEAAATVGSEAPLAMAVRLHGYVNYAQLAHGTVSDVAGVIKLVRQALADERLIAQTTTSVAGEVLGRVATEGVGSLLGLINVGFDAYQLVNAQNDVQRAQFGTQLAFDSAGVVLTLGGFAVGGTVGAFLGGGGVILGGLAIGVAALAQGFALIAEEAKQVGLYFYRVDQAYREGGYTRDTLSGSMVPKPVVVFKTIDLRNKILHFGSPALFPLRDHFGVPDYDVDDTRATDIRQGLGLPETAAFTPGDTASIVLPCTPATYFGYWYKTLPGATNRHDLGFDIARKLVKKNAQGDWQFMFDFWSFPGEYILYKMFPTYRATTIQVVLDDVERSLIVPQLPAEWHGLITYEIEARQGRCAIVLNPGVALNLKAAPNGSMHWEFVASWASEGDVIVTGAGALSIGDTHIRLAGGTHDLLLRLKNDQTVRVDWQNKQLLIVEQDGLANFGTESLAQHFAVLSQEHRLAKPYTQVHNYLIPFEPVKSQRRTNAYYEADRDRFLYVRDIDDVDAEEAILGGVIGDHAFFYTPDSFIVWQVDAVTGLPIRRYRLLVAEGSIVSHCGVVEGGVLQVVQKITRADRKVDELTYVLHEQQLYLTSVSGDLDAQVEVALAVNPSLGALDGILQPYAALHFTHVPEGTVDWLPADIVSICWRSPRAQRKFAWVRSHDGLIIRSRLPDKFISPSLAFNSIDLDDATYSRDLSLVLVNDTPEQIAVIYDRSAQALYRQVLQRPAGSKGSPVSSIASRVNNVISTESGHVVMIEGGLFFNLSPEGTLQLAGVNEAWVKEHPQWWQALPAVAEKYPVSHFAILGLMNYSGEARIGAWYLDGRLLLVDAGHGKELRLLGLTPDKQAAWVFDLTVGEIYRQPFVEPERLKEMFAEGTQVLHREGVPNVQPEWAHWSYADVVRQGAGLQATTHEGLLMMLNDHEPAYIVGVQSEWVGQQSATIQDGLRALVSEYSHAPFLSVAGADHFQWYVSATDRLISVPGKLMLEPVELLGTQRQSNVLLFDTADGRLHTYPMEMTTGPLTYLQRHDEVLSIEGQGRLEDLLPLLPDDVTTLVLRLGQGGTTCHLSTVAWLRLESIIVECRGSLGSPNPTPGKLIWDLESPEKVLVSLFDEHLIFIDPDSGHSLIFREIHAKDAALRGQVFLGLKGYPSFELETLVKLLKDKSGPDSHGLLGDLLRAINHVPVLQSAA